MNKTVSSVIEKINEWPNPQDGGRPVYFVTAFFTDGEVGSAGRKDMDAALEVQGLLQEAIGQELDFILEPKSPTKSGKPAWKILGFGTPGGAATYTAPGSPGAGSPAQTNSSRSRSPEHDQFIQERMDRRTALMQAAPLTAGRDFREFKGEFEACADFFYDWLRKTSDASSAYPSTDSPSVTPAGASEDSGGGVETKGKEAAPPPHEHDATEAEVQAMANERERAEKHFATGLKHEHDWQPHPNLHGWLTCDCGENRKKYAP